jgi:hypothetical protein
MNRPEIRDVTFRPEPEGLALTMTMDSGIPWTFRVSDEALESLQTGVQAALGGRFDPPPFPICRVCHGKLALAREFWVHEVSDMDTHRPEPVWDVFRAVTAPTADILIP